MLGVLLPCNLASVASRLLLFVRASQTDSSGREDALRKLRSADIRIIEGSPDDDQDKLAELLRDLDTVVTAIASERDD